jgi:hypothetical protein
MLLLRLPLDPRVPRSNSDTEPLPGLKAANTMRKTEKGEPCSKEEGGH